MLKSLLLVFTMFGLFSQIFAANIDFQNPPINITIEQGESAVVQFQLIGLNGFDQQIFYNGEITTSDFSFTATPGVISHPYNETIDVSITIPETNSTGSYSVEFFFGNGPEEVSTVLAIEVTAKSCPWASVSSSYQSVIAGIDGDIWAVSGTNATLSHYENDIWVDYDFAGGGASLDFEDVIISHDSLVCILGNNDTSLYVFDGTFWSQLVIPTSLNVSTWSFLGIQTDLNKNIWISGDKGHLILKKDSTWEKVEYGLNNTPSDLWGKPNFGTDGSIWWTGNEKIHKFLDDVWTSYSAEQLQFPTSPGVRLIGLDESNDPWVSHFSNGESDFDIPVVGVLRETGMETWQNSGVTGNNHFTYNNAGTIITSDHSDEISSSVFAMVGLHIGKLGYLWFITNECCQSHGVAKWSESMANWEMIDYTNSILSAQYFKEIISTTDTSIYVSTSEGIFERKKCRNIITEVSEYDFNTLEKLNVFPNPSADLLHFEGIGLANSKVQLFDQKGLLILNQQLNNSSLDINHLSPGVYVLYVINQYNIHQQQVVIE